MMGGKWPDVGGWQSCFYLDFSQKQDDMNVLEGILRLGVRFCLHAGREGPASGRPLCLH